MPVTPGKWYARDMADVAAAEASQGSKKFAGGHGGVAKVKKAPLEGPAMSCG